MLHVLYIIINISCPKKNKKSGNVMQSLTVPNVYCVNRRAQNFYTFISASGTPSSRKK